MAQASSQRAAPRYPPPAVSVRRTRPNRPSVDNALRGFVASTKRGPVHFSLQRAMKPLVLTVGLRVHPPAVQKIDPKADQPHAQLRERVPLGQAHVPAPGRAVVYIDSLRYPTALERMAERGLHCGARLC